MNLDSGFRVLKIDTSNMRDIYYAPDTVQQEDLLGQVDNIRPDRAPEDLLFQVLVDWGIDLALPISEEQMDGKTVFFVDGNALAACFDTGITDESGEGRSPSGSLYALCSAMPATEATASRSTSSRSSGSSLLKQRFGPSSHEISVQSTDFPNRSRGSRGGLLSGAAARYGPALSH